MKHKDAMEIGKQSILSLLSDLRSTTIEKWNDMMQGLEEMGGDLNSPAADRIVNSKDFADEKAHRFAAICTVLRYLHEESKTIDSEDNFKATCLSLGKDGKSLYDVLTDIDPRFWDRPIGPKDEPKGMWQK